MSNTPPSPDSNPSEKSSPLEKASKEGTERDLWDFDSDDGEASDTSKPVKQVVPGALPTRKVAESPIQSRKPTERHINPPEVEEVEPTKPAPAEKNAEKAAAPEPESVSAGTSESAEKTPEITTPATEEAPPGESSTSWTSVAATLSKAEKIGISALVVILALGATLSVLHFSNKVPTKSVLGEGLDLPIEGTLVKVTTLKSYWREPVTTGDEPDVVRRGTKLIPVVRISAEAKSAVIRVLFRNEDGSVIGDPINRTIKGKTDLRIPATAGFDDIGMHAAYRTGESPPWIVQILEASEIGLSIDKFKLLLEAEISTDIR